jgi:hypothetical protein
MIRRITHRESPLLRQLTAAAVIGCLAGWLPFSRSAPAGEVGRILRGLAAPLRAAHRGSASSGFAAIQSRYAPEFSAHSESLPLEVK